MSQTSSDTHELLGTITVASVFAKRRGSRKQMRLASPLSIADELLIVADAYVEIQRQCWLTLPSWRKTLATVLFPARKAVI